MNKREMILSAILIAILAIAFFFYRNTNPADIVSDDEFQGFVPEFIEADYFYDEGVHTYEGVVLLPTPCYSLESEAIVRESYPEQVTISFLSEDSGEVCIQVIDERPFKVIFQASEEANIDVLFNDQQVPLVVKTENGFEYEGFEAPKDFSKDEE